MLNLFEHEKKLGISCRIEASQTSRCKFLKAMVYPNMQATIKHIQLSGLAWGLPLGSSILFSYFSTKTCVVGTL